MSTLSSVVTVDQEKCVNCHACIAVCPVKYCNDGSGDYIAVDDSLCIGCGSCITACTHQARLPVDDAPRFFADVGTRSFVAIAAPAVAASFPGQYLRLNGWLAELGVEAVFDVAFGAELTVKSYLEHIRRDHPKAVIAQPCPAVVTYIQLHRPELLPYLAPADSPMAHTIKMIREFFPEFRSHRILVLSPCVAKRREFDALGLGDEVYNVTYRSIQDHLESRHIPLADYPEVAFRSPAAERAVTFGTPGGLLHTVTREVPEAPGFTRKIEGPRVIYPYLDGLYASIERGENPLLIDGLNCEWGCNGGTGTNNEHRSPDQIEALVRKRDVDSRKTYRSLKALGKVIGQFWKEGIYGRTYTNLVDQGRLKEPDEAQLKDVYARMAKHDQKDIYNCNSCGYGDCRKMAVAVFNGLNKPENCHHYNLDLVRVENEKALAEEAKLTKVIQDNAEVTRAIEAIVARMAEDGLVIAERSARLTGLSEEGQGRNAEITAKLGEIALSLQGLDGIVKTILDLARRSNLLSLNATIEASRAGKSGAAFAVVADEVKRMAGQTQIEAKKIEPFAQELKALMSLFSQEVGRSVEAFQDQVGLIRDLSTVATRLKAISGELEEKSRLLSGGGVD